MSFKQSLLLVVIIIVFSAFVFIDISPEPWPKGSTIAYYDETSYDRGEIGAAFGQWAKTGISLSFKETSNRHNAAVIFSDHQLRREHCKQPEICVGNIDQVGYHPGEQTIIYIAKPEKNETSVNRATTMIHEIGHLLGLVHGEKKCSVMSAEFIQGCEGSVATLSLSRANKLMVTFDCGPWKKDIEKLRALYQEQLEVPGKCQKIINPEDVSPAKQAAS